MCGMVGIVNYKENIIERKEILEKMLKKLEKIESNDIGYFLSTNAIFGHKRLSNLDIEKR